MAKRISQLAELTDVASDDLLVVVDKSDTSMADSGTDKKVKKSSLAKSLLDFFYPVGTIYETTSGNLDTVDKMNTHFGGTWEVYGSGRVLVGKASSGTFATAGATMGAETHTLTVAEMPAHKHKFGYTGGNTDATGSPYSVGKAIGHDPSNVYSETTSTGGDGSHNNIQPSIVVYRYRRTA